MENLVPVAVLQGDRRRGTVARALDRIAADIAHRVGRSVRARVLPQIDSRGRPHRSIRRETLSAVIDALLAAGTTEVQIVAAADRAESLGYGRELWGRPVTFVEPSSIGPDGFSQQVKDAAEPIPLVSLAVGGGASSRLARSHLGFEVGPGLANLGKATHSPEASRGLVVPFRSCSWWRIRWSAMTGRPLPPAAIAEIAERRDAFTSRLATALPCISLIDAFVGRDGNGRGDGRIRTGGAGVVIAGADAVAVDAVAAALAGFEPLEIPHLRLLHERGLGCADFDAIPIVGHAPARLGRRRSDPGSEAIPARKRMSQTPGRDEIGWLETATTLPHDRLRSKPEFQAGSNLLDRPGD
jgi:hypothetical protein